MNDNSDSGRASKWKELVFQYFGSRYGGTREQWTEANTKALYYEIDKLENHEFTSLDEYYEHIDRKWIENMFECMHIPIPENYRELRYNAKKFIMPLAIAPFDGIIDTVRALSENYTLYTASNQTKFEMELILTGMGIREYFGEFLFGPDLVGIHKRSVEYYQGIFQLTGIPPKKAIIIEDTPRALKNIQKVGAIPIQSCLSGDHEPIFKYHFSKSDEVISIIENLNSAI